MSHSDARAANEKRIADQLRRINNGPGGGALSEQKIRDEATRRANAAAERAARDEKT